MCDVTCVLANGALALTLTGVVLPAVVSAVALSRLLAFECVSLSAFVNAVACFTLAAFANTFACVLAWVVLPVSLNVPKGVVLL